MEPIDVIDGEFVTLLPKRFSLAENFFDFKMNPHHTRVMFFDVQQLDDAPQGTGAQHSSRSHVYIGRRSDLAGYEFAGFIHDVRIYSRALKAAEIVSDMKGNVADALVPERVAERLRTAIGHFSVATSSTLRA